MHLASIALFAALLAPGVYQNAAGAQVYVGVEHSLPDPVVNEVYDPSTRRISAGNSPQGLTLESAVAEQRIVVKTVAGPLGVSIYSGDQQKRAAVILVHGADPETREMGFLIPYFVSSGLTVVAFDQRGTGQSVGNWQLSGPAQRADDVDAIFDAVSTLPTIDAKRIGVWGFSNGGWTAPLVATQRPFAFVLLKSAPAQDVTDNLLYEVRCGMQRGHRSAKQTAVALDAWRTLINAINGTETWENAAAKYDAAKNQPWFDDSILSAVPFPMSPEVASGFRAYLSFDPASTLPKVTAPTLAMFGPNDRKVDVARDAPAFKKAFAANNDFTEIIYPGAMHQLLVSKDGFTPTPPKTTVKGYPEIMTQWLDARGFLKP